MDWTYRAFWLAVTASMVILTMTACGKKSDNGPSVGIVGNVSTDSTGIVTNTTLNGYPVTFTITQLNRVAGQTTTSYSPYGTTINQSISLSVNVNGLAKTYPIQPKMMPNQTSPAPDTLGNFQVYYETLCTDYNCDNAYTLVWLGMPNMPEWRQVGVYKMFNSGDIGSIFEQQGVNNQLATADMMVQNLQQAYTNR